MSILNEWNSLQTRRRFLGQGANALGAAALTSLLGRSLAHAAPGAMSTQHLPKAKRVIYLHMVGGPAQMDLFDYKPEMQAMFDKDLPASIRNGQRLTTMTSGQTRFPVAPSKFKFSQAGKCGMWMNTELLPNLAKNADDICWMRPGADGRLYAINPEAGYFGVAPGTSAKTNPNALAMLNDSAIFTNVAVTADNQPWWEGLPDGVPVKDWQGRDVDPANGPAAHPNSRFTVSATRCPSYTAKAEDPRGVPLSAIVFGGRRESLVPLVFEARDWKHGVLVGAGMASETTAAATGAVDVVRRDTMAMKPFAGYNFGDYFAHWLSFDVAGAQLPKIFHVNWFRKSAAGKFLWPGFGDNMRVLEWMLKRVEGKVAGRATAIGTLPQAGELNRNGLAVSDADLETLLAVDTPAWRTEVGAIADYLEEFGERTPRALFDELEKTAEALA